MDFEVGVSFAVFLEIHPRGDKVHYMLKQHTTIVKTNMRMDERKMIV